MNRFRALTILLAGLALSPAFAAEAPKTRVKDAGRPVSAPVPDPLHMDVPQALQPRRAYFGPPREFLLNAASQPTSLVTTADGAIWFAAAQGGAIGRLDRTSGAIAYFALGTGAKPYAIAETRDRAIVAVDRALNVLHRLNPETGEVTRLALPPDTPFLDLTQIRVDLDGRIWFVGAGGWLGSYDPATGRTDVSSHEDFTGFAFGATTPSGTIWFVSGKAGRMIHIDPLKTRFDSASLPPGQKGVRGVTAGPSGEIWVSFMQSHAIARYSGRGSWRVLPLPWADSLPQALVARSDGTLVIADAGRRKLLRFDPRLERFDEVGNLGAGGNIRAMIDLGEAIAVADMGSDRILVFPDDPPKAN